MFRLVAFCLVCAFIIGCGGGSSTGPGGNNGTAAIPVSTYCPQAPCMNVAWDRSGSDNPIMEERVWVADCTKDPQSTSPVVGSEQTRRVLADLRQPISVPTPMSAENVNYFGRMTYMDKENNQREHFGNTGCIKNPRSQNTDVRLEMAQIR